MSQCDVSLTLAQNLMAYEFLLALTIQSRLPAACTPEVVNQPAGVTFLLLNFP
jgi:hypothetical protein